MLSHDTLRKAFADFPKAVDATDPANIYVGFIDDKEFYRIIKININGSVYTFLYPDGKDGYKYFWVNRYNYNYN